MAHLALTAPRRLLGVVALVTVALAVVGIPVAGSLSAGGMTDPTAGSSAATRVLSEDFGQGDLTLLVTVTAPEGAAAGALDDATTRAVGTDVVAGLQRSSFVSGLRSPWTSPPQAASTLLSIDGRTALVVAGIGGGETAAQRHAADLVETVVRGRDGVTVRAGGDAMVYAQVNEQTQSDLLLMESLAIPLSFLVLVWVFGGLLAAALPLLVGVFAILGSLAVLRVVATVTDVSVFALNITVALGLALAIDSTLLVVSRYRDELADGRDREEALRRTMATAGRTVCFSAMTVALSMVAMALFPMYFLRSFAYAGVAVVAFAALAALVITPAALVLLGDRVDAYDVRRLLRRVTGRADPAPVAVEQSFWYRWTRAVLRRPLAVGGAVTALLVVLGLPFAGAVWGSPDERVLPTSASARQVGDLLRDDFASSPTSAVTVVLTGLPDDAATAGAGLGDYAARLSQRAGVSAVSSPLGTFVDGALAGPPVAPTGAIPGRAYLTVVTDTGPHTAEAERQLDDLSAVTAPPRGQVALTGTAAINRDSVAAVTSRLPLVLAVIAAVTFVLLFLLTGSVVLPLKALLLNMLSLSAAFGALVWVFQDGHLGGFGTTATGTLVANVPVLLFCIAFGLSMDYEVYLLSRIREYWRETGDTDTAVALGLARTGRVVTAAAIVMGISFAALIAAQVSFMRMFGVGLTLAVLVDATLVRMVLLPVFMHLLGRRNWWAPAPLARLHARIGLDESGPRASARTG